MQQTTEAGRPMVLLVVCLALIAAGPRNADAGSRGTKLAIGAGILGAIILSERARKKRVVERPSSRKTVEPRSKSASRDYGANEGRQARSSRVQETGVARRARQEKSIDAKPETVEAMPSEGRIAPVPHSEGAANPAAKTGSAALPAAVGGATASAEFGAGPGAISTPAEIKSAQEHLRYLGYDIPATTGAMDLKTKIAIMQFQESIGGPSTGALTVQQLQTLFVRAAGQMATGQ
jgi:hypothetical protein